MKKSKKVILTTLTAVIDWKAPLRSAPRSLPYFTLLVVLDLLLLHRLQINITTLTDLRKNEDLVELKHSIVSHNRSRCFRGQETRRTQPGSA